MAQPHMAQPTAPSQPARQKSFLRDTLEIVFLALVLYVVIQYAVQTVHVLGSSMYSTLHDNDLLVASKISYKKPAAISSSGSSGCPASGSTSRTASSTSMARC
jgi:hypothetical protein